MFRKVALGVQLSKINIIESPKYRKSKTSKNILLNGFVNEVIDKVSIPSLKINLINQINDWMK